jgi:hypothetical protein
MGAYRSSTPLMRVTSFQPRRIRFHNLSFRESAESWRPPKLAIHVATRPRAGLWVRLTPGTSALGVLETSPAPAMQTMHS